MQTVYSIITKADIARKQRECKNTKYEKKKKENIEHLTLHDIPYLPGESRDVHGVGCKPHSKSHGRLHTKKPRNQLFQLLVDVQVP